MEKLIIEIELPKRKRGFNRFDRTLPSISSSLVCVPSTGGVIDWKIIEFKGKNII